LNRSSKARRLLFSLHAACDLVEVKEGFECGLNIKNYNDIQENDQLEFFEIREVARTL